MHCTRMHEYKIITNSVRLLPSTSRVVDIGSHTHTHSYTFDGVSLSVRRVIRNRMSSFRSSLKRLAAAVDSAHARVTTFSAPVTRGITHCD